MVTLFRWLLRFATGLVVLAVGALALVYFFASRSLPDYSADLEVAGIGAEVEIVRDNANVPHIFGASDADVFFALGFAHAQDRLWQMTMLRRTAQGRLSELFGERTFEIDNLLRRLDLYRISVASVEDQSPETRDMLSAYAAGVNAWIGEVNAGARGRGAPEMWLFSHPISPWQDADSIAIIKLMALQLASHGSHEVLRARTQLLVPPERLHDILPEMPGDGIVAAPPPPERTDWMTSLPRYAAAASDPVDALSPVRPLELAGASNAWTAAPDRSAAGATLLANDPHLQLTAPSFWFLARLELETGGVIGGTIPGVPVVLSGRSANLGWGLTTSYLDDQDLYIERLNPDNPNEYLTPDGFKPFVTRDSIVQIKDAPARTLRLRWTENGPVLPAETYDSGLVTPEGHVMSMAWTALSPDDTSLTAARRLMSARSVEDGVAASELYIAPSQNLTLSDPGGIALKTIGIMPRRREDHQSQGRIPSRGWLEQNRWDGMLDYADAPEFVDPEEGILGNTNNMVVNRPFPNHISFRYGDTQRVNRWSRLMQMRRVHTRESFIEAQLDTVSFTARSLLPLIGADLWFTGDAAPDGTPERMRQRALELLGNWNGEMNEHLPEPLLYAAWIRFLQERLIRDELGPVAREYTHVQPLFIERVFRDTGGASAWCDVVQSARVETCPEIARQALDDALIWVGETYGTSLESLRWGDAHTATHDHPVLGETPILRWFVNIRQSTSGGDNTLLRGRTAGSGEHPFYNVHGAGYRGVYDFADPDSSVFIISTGQSGHPLSRHYDDLGELWRRGEYIPMSLDPDLARAASVGTTILRPVADDR
ncbi:penicillin acylase family protein [Aestuariibius insulae]|uniref:penicillin acylase family protein n=1 Tax=Aestuariibius insulae TaxID=2058287 RepID=UPI00345E4C85